MHQWPIESVGTTRPCDLVVHAEPCDDPDMRAAARVTASRFGLRFVAESAAGPRLVRTREGLELRDDAPGCLPLRPRLTQLDGISPAGRSRRQPLARAVGLRAGRLPPRILDAAAGLGEDAWLMASWGCMVTCCERHPVVTALLDDALRRAADEQPEIAQRIILLPGDARAVAPAARGAFDVVYVDPMFPLGRKTLERRPLRMLRCLVGDDPDAAKLLTWARDQKVRRVVVKRPRRAPLLSHDEPSVVQRGKAVRWDVYIRAS